MRRGRCTQRTAGVLCAAHLDCQVVAAPEGFDTAESLDDVTAYILRLKTYVPNLRSVGYDDNCHAEPHVRKHAASLPELQDADFYIDRLHQRNHKREICWS